MTSLQLVVCMHASAPVLDSVDAVTDIFWRARSLSFIRGDCSERRERLLACRSGVCCNTDICSFSMAWPKSISSCMSALVLCGTASLFMSCVRLMFTSTPTLVSELVGCASTSATIELLYPATTSDSSLMESAADARTRCGCEHCYSLVPDDASLQYCIDNLWCKKHSQSWPTRCALR